MSETQSTGTGTGTGSEVEAGRTSPGADPLTDRTRAELAEIAARYPQPRSGLLPMLHLVQSAQGRITPEGIEACAEVLGISPAEVNGVATFYTMYKRHRVGDYHVGVCTNTLCAVMGGDEILATLQDHLGIGNDETTVAAEGERTVSLEHVECNAACDYAPVVMVNWEFFDNQTPESARGLVDDLRAGREVTPTRGARLCTWRQAERVLAGFPDDRADEGPAAGEASLAGLRLARANGWRAPNGDEVEQQGQTHEAPGADQPAQTDSDDPAAVGADEQADTGRAESESKVQEAEDE